VLIVSFVGICLGLASLAGFFGGTWWVFDLLANFRHQMAVGLILCTLLLVLGRWKKSAVIVGVMTVFNLSVVLPLFFDPGRPETSDFRVLSFNIHASNRQFEDVISLVRESNADVVILHEVTSRWEGVIDEAAAAFDDWDYEVTRSRATGDLFGSLVLAPAGSAVESFGFGLSEPRAIEIVLPNGVAILGIHPLSPYTEVRHQQNDQQLQFATDWATSQEGPMVVVGDFNATPWSFPFRRLVAAADLTNSARGFGLDLTYPADRSFLIRIPIDNLLHSEDLAVVDRRLGPATGSDHLPLTVDLALVADS